ncbi:MAG: hypothetical protein IKO39_05835, partial [Treponema sp.]|nr:hypothetical protein [Treponema sp.]
MKKFSPILFLLYFSLTFFFSCSNGDSNGDDGDTPVSYTIDEKTWNETMKGLPFIKSSTSSFTFKDYSIYKGQASLYEIFKKEGLKFDGVTITSNINYHNMWHFSDSASSGKSKKYETYTERYGGKWFYWYFNETYPEIAYDFIDVGEELTEIFIDDTETLFPSFYSLTFENNTYSYTYDVSGSSYIDIYRFDFVFEDSHLASVKVWNRYEEEGEEISEFELIKYITFSDWDTTEVSLPDTHSLDEMDFEEMEDYLFDIAYDLGRDTRFSYTWNSDENSAWVKVVYSALIYYQYVEEDETSYYKIKSEDR